jgi:hypothetical protein
MFVPVTENDRRLVMRGSDANDTCVDRADQLVGDGLRVKLASNRKILSITGDGCRVNLAINTGLLRVNGDGCRVSIGRNLGHVEYNGDGGRIVLGPESLDRDRIKYRGEGGVIEFGHLAKHEVGPDKPKSTMKSGTRAEERRPRKTQAAADIYVDVCIKNRT